MNDLEITKLCAEAMGLSHRNLAWSVADDIRDHCIEALTGHGKWSLYDPFHDDAQAMALVKKFILSISMHNDGWTVSPQYEPSYSDNSVCNTNLNRAICLCVAKMRSK